MPDAVNDAWQVASIESCEQIPASPTMDLVRVSATSSVAATPEEAAPVLVLDDGYTVTRFTAMPAPPDDDGWLRCAFAVPDGLATLETAYGLELDGGLLIALPHPGPAVAPAGSAMPLNGGEPLDDLAPGALDAPEAFAVGAPDAVAPDEGPDAESPAGFARAPDGLDLGLLLAAAEATAELQAVRELHALEPGPSRAVSTFDPGGADARAAELEVWSGELERRLAEATTELDEVRAAATRDALELRALRTELASHRELESTSAPRELAPSERDAVGAAALADAHRRARSDLADHGA